MPGSRETRRPLIGVAVIVIKEDYVLVGKRRGAHGAGTWQFPGGHLEFGESLQDCARREVTEETGLEIGNLRHGPYTNDIFRHEDKHYITLFIIADLVRGEPEVREPEKCEIWQWRRWSDLPEPRFLSMENLLRQGFDPFNK